MNEVDQLLLQFGLGAWFVHELEALKHSPRFAWITPYTTGLTKFISAIYGFLVAAGLSFAFTPTGDGFADFHVGHIPISPGLIYQALTHAFGQYWGMKSYYEAIIKNRNT